MKALLLAGGRGTRLRPLTHTKNKHLLPIGNEPMIYRVIEDLIDAGIHEILVNINKGDTEIKEAIEDKKWKAEFEYIEQKEPNGMMYPIILGQKYLKGDKFILHAGDNVLSGGLSQYVKEFEKSDAHAHLLVTKVENPERFGVAMVKGNKLVKTIEKPKKFISDLAVTGIYLYNDTVFQAMQNVKPIDPKGEGVFEYYPPPVHQWLVDNGYTVTVTEVTGWWKDTGKPNDILLANQLVLDRKSDYSLDGSIKNSELEGRVEVGKGSKVLNSQVRGPVTIGTGVTIKDAYVGPYTSIGDGCTLEGVGIENSILMGNDSISNINQRLDRCLLGWDVSISEKDSITQSTSFFVGDNSVIGL